MKQIIKILLLVPIICLVSCFSLPTYVERSIPLPALPYYHKVEFVEVEGGLFLDYENYRRLEENIIEMRAYIETLRVRVKSGVN